jgi:hypothetical protein
VNECEQKWKKEKIGQKGQNIHEMGKIEAKRMHDTAMLRGWHLGQPPPRAA